MTPVLTRVAAALGVAVVAIAANVVPHTSRQAVAAAADPLARDLLAQLIAIDTTDGSGSVTKASVAMEARLKAAGWPAGDIQVVGGNERKRNLVARLRGRGARRPILLLAHLDVVEARRDDWSVDPFTFLERGGFYYGRGTTDMKDMAAAWIANLIRYRREGFVPEGDLIVALTADEETGDHNGVSWLLANRRDLIDAEYCVTEGGGGQIRDGRYAVYQVQAAEKVYLSFVLEARDAGGHSSLPTRENPIYIDAGALSRLARTEFPVRLNEVTRAYFARMARFEKGGLAADFASIASPAPDPAAVDRLARTPFYNAQLRTTCVATLVEGGHAENALPQLARATVNCRMLPDEDPAAVEQALTRAVADPKVTIRRIAEPDGGPASPLKPEVVRAVEAVVSERWPGVPVIPSMSTGATDGRLLRRAGLPTYGVGAFEDINETRAHGRDERIGIRQFNEEVELLHALVKRLAGRE